MAARIRWTASIVDSVPELPNRHSGWPNRSERLSATTMESSVGWAKWVPRPTRARTASTIAGWAWPASDTPYPPWKSEYSLPSTSYTLEPAPWLIHTACGSATCQLEVAPPASVRARSDISRLRGWRSRKRAVSSSIRVSIRVDSSGAISVAVMGCSSWLLARCRSID